jgi:hypothetical protein
MHCWATFLLWLCPPPPDINIITGTEPCGERFGGVGAKSFDVQVRAKEPEAVFKKGMSGITDPGLLQRRQFRPDFLFVWIKLFIWRNLLSHWLLWRAGLWIQPIVSDFPSCCKLFMKSTNFRQKILDYFISTISSRLLPHREYHLWRVCEKIFIWFGFLHGDVLIERIPGLWNNIRQRSVITNKFTAWG